MLYEVNCVDRLLLANFPESRWLLGGEEDKARARGLEMLRARLVTHSGGALAPWGRHVGGSDERGLSLVSSKSRT